MIEVEVGDSVIEFPDDTDMETMQRVVDEYLASQGIAKPKEPQPASFSSEDIGTVDQTIDDPFGVGIESGKAFVGGFGKGLLGAVSGTVELADAATNYIGWEDAITEDGYGKDIIDFANAGKELIDENIGVSEAYQDNWLVKFGGGLGSFASFLVPGGALGLAGRAANGAKVLAGIRAVQISLPIAQGVGLGAQEQVDRIDALRQQGVSIDRDTEDKAVLLGGIVGASEALSPLSILKKIRGFKNEESKKKAFNRARSAIREGTVEGTQEVAASLLQDAIADNLYDENVQYGESAWDDFSIGFTTAALTDALTGYAFKERKKITREASLEREAALRDQTEQEVQLIYDRIDNDKAEKERDVRKELARIQREDEEAQAAATLQLQEEQSQALAAEVSKGPALPLDNDSKKRLNSGRASLAEVIPSYARQLSKSVLFPDGGTYEVVEEIVDGVPQYKAIHTQTGRQWGEAGTYEYATHLMSNLNRRIIENSINNSVVDSINEADQEYDHPTTEALFRIGRILNNPKSFKITSAELNEAAGTVDSPSSPYNEGASLDALHRAEWNVEPLRQRGIKYYKPLSNLTAAQQINFERAKKGLPPTNEFTFQEAESVLKENMPKLFDSLVDARIPVIEAATRVESIDSDFAEVPARRKIRDALTEKNIVSDISSPEIKYLFESITGKKSLDDMSASQKRHLFHSIQTLPRLDSPSNIPNFKPKTYGKNQLAVSTDFVIETGDGTVENIQTSISESVESESQRKIIAKEIHKDLKDKGVINEDNTVAEIKALPSPQDVVSPEQDPVAEEERVELPPALKKAIEEKLQLSPFLENRLNKFTSNLRDELDALGLKDVGLDLSQELQDVDVDRDGNIIRLGKYSPGTTGFYKPYANTIFLALDRVQGKVRNKNLADMIAGKEVQDSSDAIFDEVRNVLSHEIVHAMRKMDLWTDKEWSSLENLARKKMRKGNISYLRDAEMAYRDKELSKVAIMEEAVANLIRDARSNPGLITGKPRALVNRIKEFFERMGSLLRGTGFQSFGDIVNALESGEIGSRSRYADTKDVADIRTLETTERKLGAVPERGIGTESDVRYDRARLKVMGVMADENQISESLMPPRFHDSPIWGPDFVKLFEELEAKIGGEREVAETLNISYEDYLDYKQARTRIPLDIRQDMLYAVSEPDYPDPKDEVSVARFAKEQKEKRLKALKDMKKKIQEFSKERINQIKNLKERELYRGFNKGDVFELTNPNTGVITRYKVLGLDAQEVNANIVNEELDRDYPTKKAVDKLYEDYPFHLINNPNRRIAELIPYKGNYIRPTIRVEAVSNDGVEYVTTLYVSDSLLERAKHGLISFGESDFKFTPKLIEDDPRFDDLTKPVEAIEEDYYGREDDVGEIQERKAEAGQETRPTDTVRGRDRRSRAETERLYEEAKSTVKDPELNTALQIIRNQFPDYEPNITAKTNPQRQEVIAFNYDSIQSPSNPNYQETELERDIFNQYKELMPEVLEAEGITDYKSLVEKSYERLAQEVESQYKALIDSGVEIEWNPDGSGDYADSTEMLADALLNKHLWVFQGGDVHPYLGAVDENGISINEKFRAVHDYFGHATSGATFGPQGEERAWANHSQTFSPLATIAMSSETRGQNSWVNYSGQNEMANALFKEAAVNRKRYKQTGDEAYLRNAESLGSAARDLFRYAEQKEIALPPSDIIEGLDNVEDYRAEESGINKTLDQVDAEAEVNEAIEKNPEVSLQRVVDEAVTRPILEERAAEGNPVPLEIQSKTYSLGDKILYYVADKFIGLKNIEEQINRWRKERGLPPIESLSSAYQGEERIAGMVANEVRAFTEDFQKPLAEKIGNATDKLGIDADEVDEFLILRHAIERNKRIYQKDKEQDPNQNPGSGSLPNGEILTDSFVKQRMRDRYGMTWNDNRGEWSGGNERAKTLNDIASDVDNIVNTTIDRQVQGDLLSRNDAKIIKNIFKYYTPLRGKEAEDDIASVIIGGGGLGVKGSDIMTAKGRRSAAETPLGHVMLNAQKAISRSVKNKEFGHSLKRLIEENPDDNFWRVISPDSPKYSKEFDTSYTYVGSDPAMQGQRVSSLEGRNDPNNWVKQLVLRRNSGIAQDKDLLVTKVDGKPVYIEIDDPRLRAAFLSLDGSTLQDWVNKFSVINRWLSMVNTSLNPEFVLGNFARDVQTAIGNLMAEQDMPGGKAFEKQLIGKVIKGIPSAMNAFYKGYRRYDLKDGTLRGDLTGITAKDKANVSEYLGAGAKADWFHSRPPEEQKATIKSMIEMSRGTFKGNFQKRFQQTMDFVEDANATVENAVRLSTFIEAREAFLDAGMGRREAIAKAASLAKNLTINFNRKGMAGDVINATYLFFNASVQGTMNFARGFKFWNKDHYSPYKTGAAGGLIAFGALLSMIADEESEELEDGRPAYDSIPDYVKERNIVIMADEPDEGTSNIFVDEEGNEYRGKQNYYTIPLPYGYNVFFNIGQSMYDVTSDKKSVPEAGSYLTSALIGSFFPVGTATSDNAAVSFVKTVSPTFTDPFVDLAVNENFWGSPIIKEDLPFATETARSAKAMASTRKEIVDATQWLNSFLEGDRYEGALGGWGDISPDALQYLMNYALGAAGTTAVRSYSAIENWAKGEDLKSQDIPFIRRIKGETTTMNTQSRFYDRKQKIQQNLKRLDPLRDEERIKFRKKIQPYITMSFKLKAIEKDLKILAEGVEKARQDAYENPDKAFEYAKKEQDLYEQRGRLYSQFNRQYDKIVGKD